MMERTFQPAGPDDLERLFPFIKAYYEFDDIPFQVDELRKATGSLLHSPTLGRAWIIRAESRDVGYVILTFGYDLEFGGAVATATELYIAPDYRRRGLGTRAIQLLEDVCREHGIGGLELQVEKDNVEARMFYQKLGFREHGRIPMSKEFRRTSG